MHNKKLEELIIEFANYLKYDLGYSDETVYAYKKDLFYIYDILELNIKKLKKKYEAYRIVDITKDEMSKLKYFLRSGNAKGVKRVNSKRTIARKISSLNSFYKFLEEEKKLITKSQNIMLNVKMPKLDEKELLRPDLEQIIKLFNHIRDRNYRKSKPPLPEDFEKRSMILFFHVLFNSMVRREEITKIKVKDVDIRNKRIKVIGKGNKERFADIDSNTIEMIEEYIGYVKLSKEDFLIRNRFNKKINKRSVGKRIKTFVKELELPEWITPHKIRKASASIGNETGLSIEHLQRNLGHKDIKTTQLYVLIDDKKKKEAFEKSHPMISIQEKLNQKLVN
jgi:site-specific recombinase XerD